MALAGKLDGEGRLAEAEDLYRKVLDRLPDFHPAYHALALLAYRFDKLDVAVDLLESAVALAGDVAVYHRDRGEMCRRLGRLDEAVTEARRATELDPGHPEGHYNLGLALADRDDAKAALASYEQAVSLAPDHGQALNNMGSMLEEADREADAELAYRRAVTINPNHSEALNNLGSLLSKTGRIAEARELFEQSLTVNPTAVASHHNLSSLKKYTVGDPHLAALESMAPSAPSMPMPEKAQYYFTLGKALDDCGRYDEAFAAYAGANRLKKAEIPDPDAQGEAQVEAIIRHLDAERIASLADAGIADPAPVFIVGMPRSGTSLIEQILASHADVHGAGELKDLHQLITEVFEVAPGRSLAVALAEADPESFTSLGERYLAAVRERAPKARRITDKMPANFHYLGIIYLALPGAKIIHSARDPMDSCLSCFTKLFNETMAFAYDLETLGRYYDRYMRLMAHWRSVLPADFILEVPYADVVDDVEAQTRRMLEFLDLPWDDDCLKFYDNDRPVRTASLAQVRNPIYKSSVAGWKRFEKHLGPLNNIVKDHRQSE